MSETIIADKNSSYTTLVLSGGSVRGIALLGALQYAYDNFLLKQIDTYIGTSAGAMICYLLCIGYTPVEIIVYLCTHQLMEKLQSFNIVALLQGRGASSFHNLSEHLEKMTIAKLGYLPTLGDLYETTGKTLICSTHNITKSKTEYLSPSNYPKLPCITALRMSANLPLVFEAYKYGSSFYVDGGISDNFPIQNAPEDSKVLGIVLTEGERDVETALQQNVLEYIYELMFIPIIQSTQYKINQLREKQTLIELALSTKFKFFNFNLSSSAKLTLFSEGYEQMKSQITRR
jgi:predicted acylesterase/phospholipase RssA